MSDTVGIDLGTSAIKIARFSRDGRMIHCAARPYHDPQEHEVPVQRIWSAIVEASREVAKAAANRPPVVGIGLCSQTNSFLLTDVDGRSLTPVFLWTGDWAGTEADELQMRLGAPAVAAATGMRSLSGQLLAPKCLREKRGQKPFSGMTFSRPPLVWLLPDWLTWRLCGRAVSTPSLWSLTGFYDIERCGWWREMLEACGLQAAQLPVLSVAGQPAGGLRADAAEALGVQPGLPVAVGVLDHLAGAITAGNTKAGRASVSLGTAACAIVTHAERPEAMEGGVVGRHPADDKLWYALAWSGLSAGGVNWYAREKGGDHTLPSVLESAAGIARGADGWQAVPRDPNDGAAGFTFTQGHGYDGAGAAGIGPSDAQAVRAILECLAREIRGLLSRASCGRGIERVTAIGGGARSDVWLRVLADELGIPVDRPACVEASVRGASLLAERAAGGAGSQSSGMSHG